MATHPWLLVAPWYRWKQGEDPRASAPAIQKYETSDLVTEFMKDPQHSLRFDNDDLVVTYKTVARITTASFPNPVLPKFVLPKKLSVSTADSPTPPETEAVPGTVRKLFLDSHKRFYLVTCELRCDAAGLPSVNRDQACEVGFVIRRRRTLISEDKEAEGKRLLKDFDAATLKYEQIQASLTATLDAQKGISKSQLFKTAIQSPLSKQKLAAAATIEAIKASQQKLLEWTSGGTLTNVVEGWIPGEFDKIGSWQSVDDEPTNVEESTFPLYPLIPNPSETTHAGAGRTIYFGLIPTGSADTTDNGTPRFDTSSTYEIRCFVRRHKADCPKKRTRGDCPGEIVWSETTEVYQIASHFDLVGTSNRPITMQMPNVPELAAQAASLPPAKIAPFRMQSPNPESNLCFDLADPEDSNTAAKKDPGGLPEICMFAIPLITIVATFVLKLFLPIVTFLFGLFFLLKLKLCILPSFSLSAGVTAALEFTPPSLDIDVDFEVSLSSDLSIDAAAKATMLASFDTDPTLDFAQELNRDLKASLDVIFGAGASAEIGDEYSNAALLQAQSEMALDPGEDVFSVTASLQFETPVARADVELS